MSRIYDLQVVQSINHLRKWIMGKKNKEEVGENLEHDQTSFGGETPKKSVYIETFLVQILFWFLVERLCGIGLRRIQRKWWFREFYIYPRHM